MSKDISTPWGEIGYITYKRTYSRRLKEGDANSPKEEYSQTIDRVINGAVKQLKVPFTVEEQIRAKEIMLSLKGTVAGRFLWQLGTKTVDKLGLPSLQNCAFTVIDHPITPFTWAFDMLMLGSGVGYNLQREFVYKLPKVIKKKIKIIKNDVNDADFIVPDSREGWVKLLGKVLKAYFYDGGGFSYSTVCIRSKGSPIKGFGGTASGPEDLVVGMSNICKILDNRRGKQLRPIDCLDVMNIIGSIVVAGNVRRSAQIAIGDFDDIEFLSAKKWNKGNIPNWRAMSNNSVVCNDFSKLLPQFWDGYLGDGEPYGLINLKLSQSCGRLGETQYPDPDVLGYNPCKPLNSLILTNKGYISFKQALKKESLKVFTPDGRLVKASKPFKTGSNREVFGIKLSNGSTLYGTDNHQHQLTNGDWVEIKDLNKGDRLRASYQNIHKDLSITNINEYNKGLLMGWIYGDGWLYKRNDCTSYRTGICFGSQEKDVIELFENITSKKAKPHSQKPNTCSVIQGDMSWVKICVDEGAQIDQNLNKDNLSWLYGKDKNFKLGFIQAWFTADGSARKGGIAALYGTTKKSMTQLCDILREFGIYAKFGRRGLAKVRKGAYGVRNQKEHYVVEIPWSQFDKIGFLSKAKIQTSIDRVKKDSIRKKLMLSTVKVEEIFLHSVEDVYDITVHDECHAFIDTSVSTHNCAEQSLAPYETCCLAEIHLPNIGSIEELKEVATYLYRINKHSLAIKCHQKETEAIVHKNMRMGIGITGYAMATEAQKTWLPNVYKYLREFDKAYSKEHNFPESIKLTTVKPSGTLSLLSGVTPGAHPGYSHFFIRRIRMASDIPLVETCRSNGFPVEYVRNFDGSDDRGTVVVEFPCKFPEHTKVAKDVSAIDQLETIKELQTNWSDNAVSVTIYYKKEELNEIKTWLSKNYNNSLKSVSFLLHSDHGFDQAPYEEITEEEYNARSSKVTPISSVNIEEDSIDEAQLGCAGGSCPIK